MVRYSPSDGFSYHNHDFQIRVHFPKQFGYVDGVKIFRSLFHFQRIFVFLRFQLIDVPSVTFGVIPNMVEKLDLVRGKGNIWMSVEEFHQSTGASFFHPN